jgi:murein endopeptidase
MDSDLSDTLETLQDLMVDVFGNFKQATDGLHILHVCNDNHELGHVREKADAALIKLAAKCRSVTRTFLMTAVQLQIRPNTTGDPEEAGPRQTRPW